ncbi:hypothetical protein IMZ08_07715 [Bacillus luteolus]|uniref:Uncharacterized protein n=1 Tax=Litchfieldia luteola TaxID=682179 RepID=A0ABR9QHG5_9BACI|nr:hypothetical protein [Cytobacillus luteolus]MBE4907937.1 hypothetical protein [Cytobacillus luteolus]MBP1942716.1 spore coat-associated protein N [Cytobacillus luteolus]
MKNVKKALIGTALTGALVVGAGFGTYSWFTSEQVLSGSIENAIIDISAAENINGSGTANLMNLTGKFAPSRSAYSDPVVFKNGSNESAHLSVKYTSTLTGADAGADLSMYRSAAVYRIASNNLNIAKGAQAKDKDIIAAFLATGDVNSDEVKAALAATSYEELVVLDNTTLPDAATETINAALEAGEEVLVFDTTDPKFEKVVLNRVLTTDKSFVLQYGVKLLEEAGNEYQGATFSARFDVKLDQVDNPNKGF